MEHYHGLEQSWKFCGKGLWAKPYFGQKLGPLSWKFWIICEKLYFSFWFQITRYNTRPCLPSFSAATIIKQVVVSISCHSTLQRPGFLCDSSVFPCMPLDRKILWWFFFSAEIINAAGQDVQCQFIHDKSNRVGAQGRFFCCPTVFGPNWKIYFGSCIIWWRDEFWNLVLQDSILIFFNSTDTPGLNVELVTLVTMHKLQIH